MSDEEQGAGEMAASSAIKRNECTPTKDGQSTEKSKQDHPSDDVEHIEGRVLRMLWHLCVL